MKSVVSLLCVRGGDSDEFRERVTQDHRVDRAECKFICENLSFSILLEKMHG